MELFAAIEERVVARVLEQLADRLPAADGPRYLYAAVRAAGYLDLPLGQVQKLTAAGAAISAPPAVSELSIDNAGHKAVS